MARKSLSANLRPDAAEAAKIAQDITGASSPGGDYQGETETASYNLPVELIELYRDLAEARLKVDRSNARAARRAGLKPPQARRSASAIVAEAMEAHRAKVEKELAELEGKA